MGREGEGGKKEVKGWKGRRKDLPDQCQTASYVPVTSCTVCNLCKTTCSVSLDNPREFCPQQQPCRGTSSSLHNMTGLITTRLRHAATPPSRVLLHNERTITLCFNKFNPLLVCDVPVTYCTLNRF